MQSQFRKNPFSRQALKNDELLSGKKHLECIKNVRRLFNYSNYQDNCKSIIIRGDRGTGKTSLLKIIQADSKKYNLIPVPLYLTESNTKDVVNFLHGLYNSLFNVCKENKILLKEINQAEISFTKGEISSDSELWTFEFINKLIEYKISTGGKCNVLAEDIINDLKLIINQLRRGKNKFNENSKLAFYIDEAHLIFSDRDSLNIIRHIIQEEVGVVFVLASLYPCEDKILNSVFDSIERAFQVYNIGYFDTISDIDQFFKKSLENVGWKENDFRLCINNYDKLIINIFNLTGGKPDFVNRIAEEMFNKVMMGNDNKMRWNISLLNKIADDLEMQSGSLNSSSLFTFNKKRAEFIIELDNNEYKWFKYLSASNQVSTPREVYDTLKYFVNGESDNIDKFKKFIISLGMNDIIAFEANEEKPENNRAIGFNINTKENTDVLDLRFINVGPDSEKYWLQIMLQTNNNREIKFISRSPLNSLYEEITKIAGFGGQAGLTIGTNESLIFSKRGVVTDEYENFSYIDFFKSLKNNTINIDELNGELLLFIYDILLKVGSNVYFFSYSIKTRNYVHNHFAFRFSTFDFNQGEEKLKLLTKRFSEDNISLSFKYETLNKSDLVNSEELLSIVYNSNNKDAIYMLNSATCNKAADLYLNDDNSKKEVIFKQLNNTLNAINLGYDIDPKDINNAGYIFMNFQEFSKANTCFDFVINRYNQDYYIDLTDEDSRSTFFLIFYNKSILLSLEGKYEDAINKFEDSIEIARRTKDPSASALDLLEYDEENKKVKILEKRKDIDVFEFIQINIELLKGLLN